MITDDSKGQLHGGGKLLPGNAAVEHAKAAMQHVMKQFPELTDHGLGLCSVAAGRRETEAERAERYRCRQRALLEPESLDQFASCRKWLRQWSKTEDLNKSGTSYGLKHVAAAEIGYLTNGSFIAAAIAEGFRIEAVGINAYLNIEDRAWRRDEGIYV